MWKEKYEAFMSALAQSLGCDNDPDAVIETLGNLKRAHDALAERIRVSEAAGETVLRLAPTVSPAGPLANRQSGEKTAEASSLRSASAAAFGNGHLETVWNYIVARAGKEKPPALLKMLMERRELEIHFQPAVINIDYETVPGAIAKLIADKYFDQPHNGYQTFLELQRRGRKCAKVTVNQALSQVAEMGFLTREEEGYRAAPGMKVTVKTLEAHA